MTSERIAPSVGHSRIRLLAATCSALAAFAFACTGFQQSKTLPQHGRALAARESADYSPDGARVAARYDSTANAGGHSDGRVAVWDTSTGEQKLLVGSSDEHRQGPVLFTPDGKRLVSILADRTIQVWDAESGAQLLQFGPNTPATLESEPAPPQPSAASQFDTHRLLVTPDSRRLISVSYSLGRPMTPPDATCWDLESGRKLFGLRASKDEELPAEIGTGRDVRQSPRGRRPSPFGLEEISFYLSALQLSPDGKWLVAPGAEEITIWHAATGAPYKSMVHACTPVQHLALSPDGNKVALVGSSGDDYVVTAWDVAAGTEAFSISFERDSSDHEYRIIAFSPDGAHIAVAGTHSVMLWRTATKKLVHHFRSDTVVHCIAFDREGERLAAGCGNFNELFGSSGDVSVWSLATGRLEHHFSAPKGGYVQQVTFRPDGRQLLASNLKSVVLWELADE